MADDKDAQAEARRARKAEQYNAARRAKRAANPEHDRAVARAWAAQHREKRRQYNRDSWAKNAAKYRATAARWRERNPGRNAELARSWVQANPDKYRENQNAWRARMYRDDPEFRAMQGLRARMIIAVNRARAGKAAKTTHLVGCDAAELMRHLEAQFQPGMNWENYGYRGWHIDHIRPCASFDLTDPAQQRECFHFTNLQPLWAEQNIRKGARHAPGEHEHVGNNEPPRRRASLASDRQLQLFGSR